MVKIFQQIRHLQLYYPNDTLPTGDQIAHFGNETHSYSITAVNAYNQNATTLTLRVKAVDVIAPSGNLRVYRLNPSTLSDEEVNKVKQAFVEANRRLDIQLSDITVNNPTSGGASTVNVVVRKDKYNKTFTSHPGDMNFYVGQIFEMIILSHGRMIK